MAAKKTTLPLTRRAGWFSLWSGHFESLDELEQHVDSGAFEREQGFRIEPPLLPFTAFLDQGSAEELVRQFSPLPERVVTAAVRAIGDESDNGLVLHEFVFDATKAPKKKKKMRFLGTWRR